ncbi:guanine deaminase [Ameyamaea chiangmaiensis NBRC 103196]|uniref:Guanine deaminase n=1 Tax=Ameyamaea chiangmaiensis TaxID=442969 RepID=A0A850PDZ0_9PROT|nr:guanine deaminase [Ameyamaea chiangmaiensis]MBS4074475.1 guanine deaminase [Ameyamaea chiangmaiensis]NVN39261.1 guanine deaminase [Ameyamaea chiangmaiensis]GBQ72167.1 guanine deaminase [Ameyamaea chiangmaiensis NBRC 103196]
MPIPPLALRGDVVTFSGNPFEQPPESCLVHVRDALVVARDGVLTHVAPYDARDVPADATVHIAPGLIGAGFIDAHVHYPQLGVTGSYGEQLLTWLERYVFPAEAAFADRAHADHVADAFLSQLIAAGTTTACVYCTVHPESVDAFFTHAEALGALMIAGKVLMDRNAPDALRDTAQGGYDESKALISRWHGRGRLRYAVTPRFAPTSTQAQLDMAGALLREHDGLYMQTHIAENTAEIDWVRSLFPDRRDYLDVYGHAGLIGPRSVLGHGIYLGTDELDRCHEAQCGVAHCPSSNLFLGSGTFDLFGAMRRPRPVRCGLGSDVGAGTSLSALRTLGDGYKVAQALGQRLHAVQGFWLATAGNARALHLDHRIGTVAVGMDADLCVLDPGATPLLALRTGGARDLTDVLFALMSLGDERCVRETYIAGRRVHEHRPAN